MNNFGLSIISTFVRGVKSLRIENKKRTSELENPLALQSLTDNWVVISIISLLLDFVQCFFERGRNDTESRTRQTR